MTELRDAVAAAEEFLEWMPTCDDEIIQVIHVERVEEAVASAIAAWNRRADDWQPIETAPKDRPVEVYAPPPDPAKWVDAVCDLPEVMCIAQWHPDAGFCVCTIREVTHWREVRRPLPEGAR